MNQEPKFDFFEKVTISTANSAAQTVNGKLGAVLGRAQCDDGRWQYAVSVYDDDAVWSLEEAELTSTGEFAERSDFYDGSSVRIQVDEHGRGRIVT